MLAALIMLASTSAMAQSPPAHPTGQSMSPSLLLGGASGRVGARISWNDTSSNEDGFQVLYSIQGSSSWFHYSYLPAGSTEVFLDTSISAIPAGQAFYMAVRSLRGTYINANSFSPITAASSSDNPPAGPYGSFIWPSTADPYVFNPPTLSTATIVSSTEITNVLRVTWVDNSNCEDAFEIEARDTASAGNPFLSLGTVSYGRQFADLSNYLVAGHSYQIRMRARRATTYNTSTGEYGNLLSTAYSSNVINVSVPGAVTGLPAPPSNLTIAAFLDGGTYRYFINWDDRSTNETHFEIQEKNGANPYVSLGSLGGTAGLNEGVGVEIANNYVAGSARTFRVRAHKGVGPFAEYSAFTPESTATQGAFAAPSDLRITNPVDNGLIQVFWSDNATTENGYDFEYRLGGSGSFSSRGSISLPSLSRYQFNGGLDWFINGSNQSVGFPPSTQVEFRIRAYQGSGTTTYTSYSNTSSLTTQPLTAPSGVAVTAITKGGATVSWTDNSGNETHYQVLYRQAGFGSFNILKAGIAKNATSTSVTGLAPGTAYDIQVRASYDFEDGSFVPGTGSATSTFTTRDGFISNLSPTITFYVPFTYQAQTSNASPRTSWNITGLPAGLSFNNATGQVTGTPTTTGLFTAAMTASFQDGTTDNVNLALRIARPAASPVTGTTISDFSIPNNGNASTTSLADKFGDPDSESAVQIQTTLGNINVILYNTATPLTVANFMAYASGGRYTNVAFHRSANLSGSGFPAGSRDILQGGGYVTNSAPDNFSDVNKFPALVNEPGISNTIDTIAMAKPGGQPDGATSEFFFNVKNNSAALDNNNGGFSVFGRVTAPTRSVMQAITDRPTGTYTINIAGQPRGPFADWPMNAASAPSSMNIANVVTITSVTPLPVLSHAITANTNPSVMTAAISGGTMVITPLALGQSTITVRATDLDGNHVSQTFTVTSVSASAFWRLTHFGSTNATGDAAPDADPNHNGISNLLEYALGGDPVGMYTGTEVLPDLSISPTTQCAEFSLTRHIDRNDITLTVQAADSPAGAWTHLARSINGAVFTVLEAGAVVTESGAGNIRAVSVRDIFQATDPAHPRRFMRLEVTQ